MRQPDEHDLHDGWPEELALDDGMGPALPLDAQRSQALLGTVLKEAGFPPLEANPLSRSAGRVWWQMAAAVLLACVGLGSASAAVLWYARREADSSPTASSPPAVRRAAPPPAQPEVVPEAPAEPDSVPQAAPPRPKARGAQDWLDEANRLRAKGRWQAAEDAYARAWQTAPQSAAAYVARIAAASVRLEHRDDPRGALAHYRAALSQQPNGPLREEALFGIAEAYRKLNDTSRERTALERFLREHPESPLAGRARARLDALLQTVPSR